jgi:hypothetical protein
VLDLMENRLHQRSDGAWRILMDNLDKQSVSKNMQPQLCYKFDLSQLRLVYSRTPWCSNSYPAVMIYLFYCIHIAICYSNTTIHDPTIARYVCDWYDRRTDNQIGENKRERERNPELITCLMRRHDL